MVGVKIPKSFVTRAQKKAKKLGRLEHSILRGKGNVYGLLGEMLVAEYIGAKIVGTYDYDLIKDGVRFDVKTKVCTSEPLPEYDCSVADVNITQNCDFYVFVRILKDFTRGWILGCYSKKKYYKDAIFCREGEVDPKSNNGWQFKADCYNLPISKLISFNKMKKKKCNIVCEK